MPNMRLQGQGWHDPQPKHVHTYVFETLTSRGYEIHTCSCGKEIRYHVKE